MRKYFSNTIEELAVADESILFLTGDLGFSAFENLQKKMGERFINMGVAEQNMISAAAGMAHKGFKVFCYSIAPFIVYRGLEQFRNDVCFHNLPVYLVGNGGGYGYGIMGSSHHALEDIACVSAMQNAKTWIPAFSDDVKDCVHKILSDAKPAYLRLGLGKPAPLKQTRHGSFNCVISNNESKGTIFALGPVVNNILEALANLGAEKHFNLFTVVTLPLSIDDFVNQKMAQSGNVIVVEEHVSIGGIGTLLAASLLSRKTEIKNFITLFAKGYPGRLYGNQDFHQHQSGLDAKSIAEVLQKLV